MRLEVQNASFSYSREKPPVLDGVDFAFDSPEGGAGRVLAVLGPNGAGKTTLLKAMLGLRSWTRGKSLLDGEDVSRIPPRVLWRRVGYVPQARSIIFATSVLEMVVMGRGAWLGELAMPGKADYEKAMEALRTVGVDHLAQKKCDEISGGEYQLALVARALAADPRLLVLDEPESNLDFRNQRRVVDVIARLCEKGISAVINTHFPAHALELADKALLLTKGGRPLCGDAADVLTERELTRAFGIQVRIRRLDLPEGERTVVLASSRR